MYFTTHSSWLINNPLFKIFDSDNDYMRWNFVEMRLAVYYFHIHFRKNFINSPTTILCVKLPAVLYLLQSFTSASLSLQVPALLNDQTPGLYNVESIHKYDVSNNCNYIAKCSNDKIYDLNLYEKYNKSEFNSLENELVWSCPDICDS